MKTLERTEIIRNLRLGEYDVLVGINLLREGLDIPEVSLVAILDADTEGFLRAERSLIQTIGRAARNAEGLVIMYADKITDSMAKAIGKRNAAASFRWNTMKNTASCRRLSSKISAIPWEFLMKKRIKKRETFGIGEKQEKTGKDHCVAGKRNETGRQTA